MRSFLSRLLSPEEGRLTLLLLLVVTVGPIGSVVSAAWVDGLDVLIGLTIGGVLVSYFVTRLPGLLGQIANYISIILGPVWVFFVVAGTLAKSPDGISKVLLLWHRLSLWLGVIRAGGFGNEPVLFVLLLAEATWLASYLSGLAVFRDRSVVWPLVVGGGTLIINVSYAPEQIGYLVPFAFGCVLLISRLNLLRQESGWRADGLRYNPGIWNSTLRTGVLVAGLIAAFGWFAPEIPPRDGQAALPDLQAYQPVRDLQNEFSRAFGGLRGRGIAPTSLSGFGSSMMLGGQFRLATYPVVRIYSAEPRYWRSVIFERYTGLGWVVGQPTTPRRLEAGAPVSNPSFEKRVDLTQTVEVLQPRGDYLPASGTIISIDAPVSADYIGRVGGFGAQLTPGPNSTPPSAAGTAGTAGRPGSPNGFTGGRYPIRSLEPVAIHASLSPGNRFTVVSSVSRATPADLRADTGAYPRDIQTRYTRLPAVPQRVKDLAVQLTTNEANNYDKARALESYLRTFPYTLDVVPPPYDRDGVDYFLFDLKAGYCDYFSSAMTVMARSIGLPARVVSGYSTGTLEGVDTYVVRDNDAHSWVEVYFPSYGWIEFDPTSSKAEVQHPFGVIVPTPSGTPDPNATPLAFSGANNQVDPFEAYRGGGSATSGSLDFITNPEYLPRDVLFVLASFLLVIGGVYVSWNAGLAGLPAPAAAYLRLSRLGRLLGWQPRPSETPFEYTSRIASAAPEHATALRAIADAFVAFRFGGRRSLGGATALTTAWKSLRVGLPRELFGRALRSVRRTKDRPVSSSDD